MTIPGGISRASGGYFQQEPTHCDQVCAGLFLGVEGGGGGIEGMRMAGGEGGGGREGMGMADGEWDRNDGWERWGVGRKRKTLISEISYSYRQGQPSCHVMSRHLSQ